jgi:hypothetical protein
MRQGTSAWILARFTAYMWEASMDGRPDRAAAQLERTTLTTSIGRGGGGTPYRIGTHLPECHPRTVYSGKAPNDRGVFGHA